MDIKEATASSAAPRVCRRCSYILECFRHRQCRACGVWAECGVKGWRKCSEGREACGPYCLDCTPRHNHE